MRRVSGLYVMGAQEIPPSVPGDITTGSVQYAPKMQVLFIPSGTLPDSGHVGTNESPIGNGCVRAVFIRGSCGTARSSMPMSDLPLVRSSTYMKPVLLVCISTFRSDPW